MSITIDCADCTLEGSASCQDCIVSFIVEREPDDAVVVDVAEFAALRRLQRAGLVPELLHEERADQG
jgi:hypothetical protein